MVHWELCWATFAVNVTEDNQNVEFDQESLEFHGDNVEHYYGCSSCHSEYLDLDLNLDATASTRALEQG